MTKKKESSSESGSDDQRADAASHNVSADIPDFTAEQWAWLQAQTREREKDYVPTRSLIPGI